MCPVALTNNLIWGIIWGTRPVTEERGPSSLPLKTVPDPIYDPKPHPFPISHFATKHRTHTHTHTRTDQQMVKGTVQ